jgi:hypothetical protein
MSSVPSFLQQLYALHLKCLWNVDTSEEQIDNIAPVAGPIIFRVLSSSLEQAKHLGKASQHFRNLFV